MAMTSLKMEFYKQGVVFQWTWRNQEEYQAAKAFLEKFLGYPASAVGEVDFFYFENEEQFDALREFRRELEAGKRD
jgi:cytosine/adenosine deaminase-related metal-dependent hydrolase